MFDKQDKIKLIKLTYLPQYHTFDVECMMPGKVTPEVRRWNTRSFPEHKPFKILNGMFQVSQEVRIWIKDEKELKSEGWGKLTPKSKTLGNKSKTFTIGKRKAKFLGGQSVKGFIGLSEKMKPYVVVKDGDKYWRFTEDMIRLILPLTIPGKLGKDVKMVGSNGANWSFSNNSVRGPVGTIEGSYLNDFINLLRKAEVI